MERRDGLSGNSPEATGSERLTGKPEVTVETRPLSSKPLAKVNECYGDISTVTNHWTLLYQALCTDGSLPAVEALIEYL
jgi:hypothetical protein